MRYSYNTVSLTTPEDGKPITIATPSGTEITSSSTVAADPSTPDGDAAYPLGLVDFSFTTSHVDNLVTLAFVTDLKPTGAYHLQWYVQQSGKHL